MQLIKSFIKDYKDLLLWWLVMLASGLLHWNLLFVLSYIFMGIFGLVMSLIVLEKERNK